LFWRFVGPELACSGEMGAGISEAFCVAERPLAMESCFWARCLAHVFLLLFQLSLKKYPIGGQVRGCLWIREEIDSHV
jgi:hypothetical protein